jgi:poly-beta-1,6-N-acetyl-D-glucosamine synthase
MYEFVLYTGIALAILYFLILSYVRIGIKKIHKSREKNLTPYTFSIIIPCRNEENNLELLISSLKCIEYDPDRYEIIFVNDRSSDRTLNILNAINGIPDFSVIDQHELIYKGLGKKSALQQAIDRSKYQIILTIDADCIVPKDILKLYEEQYQLGFDVVAGPVFFKNYGMRKAFLNIQSLDYLSLMAMSAGAIGQKDPLICSGANFSYKKDCFYEVGGFSKISHTASGDDDLLLHLFSNKGFQISYLWNAKAAIITNAQESILKFIKQRIRWGSKGAKYDNSMWKYKLYLIYFFHFLIFLAGISSIIYPIYFQLFVYGLCLKVLIDLPLAIKTINFSKQKNLYYWLIPTLLFQIPYVSIIGLLSNLIKPQWK